jgi:hypothetical protein
MHQQLWGYNVEWKCVSRGTGGKKVEYHCHRPSNILAELSRFPFPEYTSVYPKVYGLAAWKENCNWYSSLPLGAGISLFCESV